MSLLTPACPARLPVVPPHHLCPQRLRESGSPAQQHSCLLPVPFLEQPATHPQGWLWCQSVHAQLSLRGPSSSPPLCDHLPQPWTYPPCRHMSLCVGSSSRMSVSICVYRFGRMALQEDWRCVLASRGYRGGRFSTQL